MALTIIVFILIFTLVVVSHEFGHFLLAKKNGIKVVEFAIGMGPTIFHKQKGETTYKIRLLPIGGACMFEGEDGIYDTKEGEKKEKPEGSFASASVWARIATVLAGPFFNILLGFLLALIIVGFSGTDKPVITGLIEGYPAESAGIMEGDVILKINGENMHLYREIILSSYMNTGSKLDIVYERDGEKMETTITPMYSEEDGRYYIGFYGSGVYEECKGFELVQYAAYEVEYMLKSTIKSLGMLFQGRVTRDDVAGPVGIAMVIDDAIDATASYGVLTVVLTMLNIALLLSVNLGVLNLLPIPALDGGRLIFLIIEAIRRKPIPPEKEGIVHMIGFVLLMILMVFVFANDIAKLFT